MLEWKTSLWRHIFWYCVRSMLNLNASRNSDTKSWITLMGTKSDQNFQNFFFFLFSQKCYQSLVCLKKNTKSLIECGIRLSPNSLLKPNSERCDNPEFSSRVLRFFRGHSSAIFICIFPLHHELHLTVEVNLLHIPKQWEIRVFMKWAKYIEVAVWEIYETGRTIEILGRRFCWSEKVWPCSLLLWMIFFGFVKPICWPREVARWPFPRKDPDPCFCAKISGIATGQHCNLLGGNIWRKVVSTSK